MRPRDTVPTPSLPSPAQRPTEASRRLKPTAESPSSASIKQAQGAGELETGPLGYTVYVGLLAFSVAMILLLAPVLGRLLGLATALLPR